MPSITLEGLIIRDEKIMNMPPSIREWSNKMAGDIDDADLREDFHHIQEK
jgi:hypothetical protein